MKRIVYRSRPKYLDEDFTLNVNSARGIVKAEIERIQNLMKKKEDNKMIASRKNLLGVNESANEDDNEDTLTPEEVKEILEKEDRPPDLNGAIQLVFPIARKNYVGARDLKRREVIDQLRNTQRQLGNENWELISAVHLHDHYNVDLYRISGGNRDYSHYEQFLYTLSEIESALNYVQASPAPPDLMDHLDLSRDKYKDKDNGLLGLKESLSGLKKKDLLNLYAQSLIYMTRLEVTSDVVNNQIRPETIHALQGIDFITTFKKRYAIVPEQLNSSHDTNLIRERLGDYIAELHSLRMALAKTTVSLAEIEGKVIYSQRMKDETLGEYGMKKMIEEGYYESRLHNALQDHRNFVYRRNYVVERESSYKNGTLTRRVVCKRRSLFPQISRFVEILKYKNNSFIRRISNPDTRPTILQDIGYPVEKTVNRIETRVSNTQRAVKILVQVISQEIEKFDLNIEKKFREISLDALVKKLVPVSNTKYNHWGLPEDKYPYHKTGMSTISKVEEILVEKSAPVEVVVPVVKDISEVSNNDQLPINVPNLSIMSDEDKKIHKLLTLADHSFNKKNYLLFLRHPGFQIPIVTLFNVMRGTLRGLKIPPASYSKALSKFLAGSKDLEGMYINMFPNIVLSEKDAHRVHQQLAAEGIQTLPIVYDPSNILLGNLIVTNNVSSLVAARDILQEHGDMQMIIIDHLLNIGEEHWKTPIRIATSKFITRQDLPKENLILIPKDGKEEIIAGDGLVKSSKTIDVRLL